jgi:hypothetical protein
VFNNNDMLIQSNITLKHDQKCCFNNFVFIRSNLMSKFIRKYFYRNFVFVHSNESSDSTINVCLFRFCDYSVKYNIKSFKRSFHCNFMLIMSNIRQNSIKIVFYDNFVYIRQIWHSNSITNVFITILG